MTFFEKIGSVLCHANDSRRRRRRVTDATGYNDKAWTSESDGDDNDDTYGGPPRAKHIFIIIYILFYEEHIRQRTNYVTLQLLIV